MRRYLIEGLGFLILYCQEAGPDGIRNCFGWGEGSMRRRRRGCLIDERHCVSVCVMFETELN